MKHLKKVSKPSKAAIWEWPAQISAEKQDWIEATDSEGNLIFYPAPEANVK